MTFQVDSEVGQLRQAIVHRPGLELSRLTPENIGELLFDDVMWAKKAKEEHDAFAQALRDKGVHVHYYGQLLAETLELPDGRAFVLDRVCTPEILGPSLVDPVRRLFEDLDGTTLAEFLVGGVLKADLHPLRAHSLKWDMLRADDFVLTPLPNHLFQRDNSCWIYGGVTINPMAKPARQRETLHTRAIYQFHPLFADADFVTYYGDDDLPHQPATIEGGDVHVIGHGAVLIGMGERTTPMAVETVAHRAVRRRAGDQGHRHRAAAQPRLHAPRHRDVDGRHGDTFVLYPYFDRHLRSWTMTPATTPTSSRSHATTACGTLWPRSSRSTEITVLTTDEDVRAAEREQWDDGTNYLAVAPGVVIGYERNVTTNTMLRKHGIEVVTIAGERARPRPRWSALHDLPDRAGPGVTTDHRETDMTIDLRGRSFLKEVDFTKDEFLSLIDLADHAPRREATGYRDASAGRAQHRPHLREDLDPDPIGLRGRLPTTRVPTSPTSDPRTPSSATRSRSRTRPGCSAACSTASSTGASPKTTSRPWPGTPACRSGTGSPTSGTRPRCWPTC